MNHKAEFIRLAIAQGALQFGQFTLKSGRNSPYFFNAAAFCRGSVLQKLGQFCADCLAENGLEFDMLFGPAYKGIPLSVATAIALNQDQNRDVPYAFNRKEAKDHGEGGIMIGAPLIGRVLVMDDVVTAGTTAKAVKQWLDAADAKCAGLLVLVDRQERTEGGILASQWVEETLGSKLLSLVSIQDIIVYLESIPEYAHTVVQMKSYLKDFGAV